MRTPHLFFPALALCLFQAAAAPAHAQRAAGANPPVRSGTIRIVHMVHVVIQTSLGVIEVDVDSAHAPITAANFLRYVDGHAYDGGVFQRTVRADNQPNDSVKIEVVQATNNPMSTPIAFPPIPLETTNVTGIKHLDGTISMARTTPTSATTGFFICVGDQPALDFGGHRNPDGQGFAAFGHVTHGMEVVRAIQASHAVGQNITPPIRILKITTSGNR